MPTQFIAKRAGTGFIQSLANASGVQVDSNDFRVKYNPDGTIRKLLIDQEVGKVYYVEPTYWRKSYDYHTSVYGSDNNSGLDVTKAFLTMTKALSVVASGDMIVLVSRLVESCVGPENIPNVTILGAGPTAGKIEWWGTTTATAAPVMQVRSPGWVIQNLNFRKSDGDAGISLLRNSGDSEAGNAIIVDCEFLQVHYGIEDDGGNPNVRVINCFFHQLTGPGNAGIICTSTAEAVPIHWVIAGNRFSAVLNQIAMSLTQSLVDGNYLEKNGVEGVTATLMLSTKYVSSQGDYNAVVNNVFGGVAKSEVASTLFYSGTNETWANNLCTDGPDAGVPA